MCMEQSQQNTQTETETIYSHQPSKDNILLVSNKNTEAWISSDVWVTI